MAAHDSAEVPLAVQPPPDGPDEGAAPLPVALVLAPPVGVLVPELL